MEPTREGQQAASGGGTKGSRSRPGMPPKKMIRHCITALSLPVLTKAFQVACIAAADRTSRVTVKGMGASAAAGAHGRDGSHKSVISAPPGRINEPRTAVV